MFLTVLLLALQPVCLLYTRAVMEGAAGQTARLMITSEQPDAAGYPLAWDITCEAAAAGAGSVRVTVTGAVEPLPVLGAFAGLWGTRNAQGDIELAVEVAYEGRPSWLEGDYETWTAVWD